MKYIILPNGVKMPLLGFGTYKVTDQTEGEQSLLHAIKTGYRLIDTAQVYNNEKLVGDVIKKCGVPREELFITTKLHFKTFDNPVPRLEQSFKDLGVDYIDLVLLHWPYGNYLHAWEILEDYYKQGRIKAIGISNFDPGRMIDFLQNVEIKPHINQIEVNIYSQRKEELEWYKKYDIPVEAYSPLGHGSLPQLLEEETLKSIAKAHNKTPAQIAIRFILQKGIVVIPKSSHSERIEQNFNVFDFSLTDEEMKEIEKLDKKSPIVGHSEDPNTVEKLYSRND